MKTIDTGPKVEDLGVSEETLAAIIVEAHAYNAVVPETDENEASNDIDDDVRPFCLKVESVTIDVRRQVSPEAGKDGDGHCCSVRCIRDMLKETGTHTKHKSTICGRIQTWTQQWMYIIQCVYRTST